MASLAPSLEGTDGPTSCSSERQPPARSTSRSQTQMAFRKTVYESVEQLQTDLDKYLDFYNGA